MPQILPRSKGRGSSSSSISAEGGPSGTIDSNSPAALYQRKLRSRRSLGQEQRRTEEEEEEELDGMHNNGDTAAAAMASNGGLYEKEQQRQQQVDLADFQADDEGIVLNSGKTDAFEKRTTITLKKEFLLEKNHVHLSRPSLLSSFYREELFHIEDQSSPQTSYRGLLNLGIIVLVISNIRLMMENIRKYGLLVDLTLITKDVNPRSWPSVITVLSYSLFLFNALFIEKLAFYLMKRYADSSPDLPPLPRSGSIPWPPSMRIVMILQLLNLLALSLTPAFTIYYFSPNPMANMAVLLMTVCLLAKLWSYGSVHRFLRADYFFRKAYTDVRRREGSYPENLYPADIFYFAVAPTLVYETHFPRTPRVRISFLLKRIVELFLIAFVEYFIAIQYMLPLLNNTLEAYANMDIIHLTERILKLAVPNLIVWLLGFYGFFHVYLNITSELLRFGDRLFYHDWWNCTSLGYFWRTWNLPVHNWFALHVYFPMINRGWSKGSAGIVIFLISAVFHEYCVSLAFKTISMFAFLGMMGQVFLVPLTTKFRGKQFGNVLFWITIMLGQPLIVLMYFVDYMHKQYGVVAPNDTS